MSLFARWWWIICCACFFHRFLPSTAVLHIQVCVDSLYRSSNQKGPWGDRAICTSLSLSHPLSKVTKCCILPRDPCDNTVCAAFEQQVNLLSLWALNSWTIHPSQASFWSQKCVCLSHNWITNAAKEDLSLLKLFFTHGSLYHFICTVYFPKTSRERPEFRKSGTKTRYVSEIFFGWVSVRLHIQKHWHIGKYTGLVQFNCIYSIFLHTVIVHIKAFSILQLSSTCVHQVKSNKTIKKTINAFNCMYVRNSCTWMCSIQYMSFPSGVSFFVSAGPGCSTLDSHMTTGTAFSHRDTVVAPLSADPPPLVSMMCLQNTVVFSTRCKQTSLRRFGLPSSATSFRIRPPVRCRLFRCSLRSFSHHLSALTATCLVNTLPLSFV